MTIRTKIITLTISTLTFFDSKSGEGSAPTKKKKKKACSPAHI